MVKTHVGLDSEVDPFWDDMTGEPAGCLAADVIAGRRLGYVHRAVSWIKINTNMLYIYIYTCVCLCMHVCVCVCACMDVFVNVYRSRFDVQ